MAGLGIGFYLGACDGSTEPGGSGIELSVVATPKVARFQIDSVTIAVTIRNLRDLPFTVDTSRTEVRNVDTGEVAITSGTYNPLGATLVGAWDSVHFEGYETFGPYAFFDPGRHYCELMFHTVDGARPLARDTFQVISE
jgi:hypothetical protein